MLELLNLYKQPVPWSGAQKALIKKIVHDEVPVAKARTFAPKITLPKQRDQDPRFWPLALVESSKLAAELKEAGEAFRALGHVNRYFLVPYTKIKDMYEVRAKRHPDALSSVKQKTMAFTLHWPGWLATLFSSYKTKPPEPTYEQLTFDPRSKLEVERWLELKGYYDDEDWSDMPMGSKASKDAGEEG